MATSSYRDPSDLVEKGVGGLERLCGQEGMGISLGGGKEKGSGRFEED